MSIIAKNQWVQDFGTFLKDSNIVNMALGFLIAQSTMDMSKSFVSSVIMPFIEAARGLKTPKFPMAELGSAAVTFVVTLLVAFIFIKLFNLQAKPIQPVIVANSNTRLV